MQLHTSKNLPGLYFRSSAGRVVSTQLPGEAWLPKTPIDVKEEQMHVSNPGGLRKKQPSKDSVQKCAQQNYSVYIYMYSNVMSDVLGAPQPPQFFTTTVWSAKNAMSVQGSVSFNSPVCCRLRSCWAPGQTWVDEGRLNKVVIGNHVLNVTVGTWKWVLCRSMCKVVDSLA